MSEQTGKTEFLPLEEGEYLVRMQTLDEVVSKKGNNMLKAKYQVIKKVGSEDDKGIKGRIIFDNYLLDHEKTKVVEIADETLTKYANAVGAEVTTGDYSALGDFLETPFIAILKIQAGTNGFPDSNRIAKFSRR